MGKALLAALLLVGCLACAAAPGDSGAPAATAAEAGGGEDAVASPDTPEGQVPGSAGSGEVLCPDPAPGGDIESQDFGCQQPPKPSGAELVTPQPGMANVRARPWDEAEPVGDGSTLRITYTSGVAPCNVLDHVEVEEGPEAVTVTLYEGSDPAQPDAVCIEIAKTKAVEVALSQPLGDREVVDGA
jgi:hypothetical protein